MKNNYIQIILIFLALNSSGQTSFILSINQPEIDAISDCIQIKDRFYFIQNRAFNVIPPYTFDSYSDLIITSEDGTVIEIFNLNGFNTFYERILKVIADDIYLVGYLKTDSCQSKLIVSKFNIGSHIITPMSSYDFCENMMEKIKVIHGNNDKIFIEEYHTVGDKFSKNIFDLDSNYSITPRVESVTFAQTLSVDFARTGYLIASYRLYNFFDADFKYRKQKILQEETFNVNDTHIPFGDHDILVQTLQPSTLYPERGFKIMILDSNLTIKKKTIIFPSHSFYGNMNTPFFSGIEIKNENEIWTAGTFEQSLGVDSGFYFIAKLDSNLNVICQHFIGYDGNYRAYGIKALDSGAIVFGSRVKTGNNLNEGEDIYAIRVGENCELPAVVATNDPTDKLISISVFPNPGINDLTFSINGFDPTILRVELIDESGKVLFTAKDLTNSISIPELPSGQYFYRIMWKEKLLGIGGWMKR